MMQPSSTTLIMAGTALVGALAVRKLFDKPSKGASAADIAELDDDDGFIDEDLVCKIFDRLFMEMQMVVAQLGQQVQQIQMSGQRFPEAQLKQLLKAEFERALMAKQDAVYDQHEVDADCLEEATWEFLSQEEDYPRVKKAVERFQKLYESISGETVVGRRPGVKVEQKEANVLSSERTIEVAEVYFGALSAAMVRTVDELKAKGVDIRSQVGQMELQAKFGDVANTAGEEALAEMGLEMKDFQASIEQNASDPRVGRTLQLLQMKQQQEMQSLMTN